MPDLPNPMPRHPRPLLITFHCGVFFVYMSVFMMSISNREIVGHFEQNGPTFIRDMLILFGVNFVGYLLLWNLRKAGIVILLLGGIPFCIYGFATGTVALVNYLPLVAAVTSAPLWPILKTP